MIHHLHNVTRWAVFLGIALGASNAQTAEAHSVVTTALSFTVSAEAPNKIFFEDHTWVEKTITGQVTDASDGTGLPGVNVLVKGTTIGTVTDLDGNYTLNAPDDAEILVFSSVGYTAQEVPIGSQSEINVQLDTDVQMLEDQVVVIGYGQVQKSDLTGSVSKLDGGELASVPSQSPVQGLQGKVAGVQVTSSSGAPGAAPFIRIRGTGTLNDASPLFVVDGVLLRNPEDINYLNSEDIESMEVLKDASATAIYGARGANGVVIITTKKGEEGAARVNADVSYGLQTIPTKIDLLNGPEWRQFANEVDPTAFPITDVPSTDWQNLVFDEPAGLLDANLSVSGGSENISYYVAAGYFQQDGVIPSSDYERISLRLNNSYKLSDNITVGHNISVARSVRNDEPGSIIGAVYRARPDIAPYTANGGFSEVPSLSNPLASIAYNNNTLTGLQGVGNIYAEATFLDHFTLRSSYGISANFTKRVNFVPEYFVSSNQQNDLSDLTVRREDDTRWFWENTLNYNQEFGVHRVDGVVGFTLQEEQFEFLESRTEGLVRGNDDLRYIDSGQTDQEQTDGNGDHQAIQSFLFRANYSYDSRYLLTVTGRLDASSVFGANYQYGFFPSVGLGWNIANEPFLEDNGVLSNLKLRGSWGVTGNDRIGAEARFALIDTSIDAIFGPNEILTPGATIGVTANENLRWEETTQLDVGLEIGFLEGRLNIEGDYYDRTTRDILVPVFVPGYFGNGPFVSVVFNTAEVLNRGFEFTVSWRDQVGDFRYGFAANGTTVHNEVLNIGSDAGVNSFITGGSLGNGQTVTRTEVGRPIGSFYGYEIAGVFQSQEEVDNSASLSGQGAGDFRYVDQNGLDESGNLSGQADGAITQEDRNFIGSPIPDFIYGFNFNLGYKGFDLQADFQGQLGNEIYNGKRAQRFAFANYQGLWRDRWTGPGTSNSVPRASSGGVNFEPSTFFVEDGSFLRLRTVTLGYNLPATVAENLSLTNARLYVRGTNLFTITNYSGYSPEISVANPDNNSYGTPTAAGIDLGVYPVTSIYSVGVNVTF
uniref:TonB-dependent receptor n=1 Tax=Roseihalotalea indica TaxID=2867963 RepID=A0AA49JEW5_9BACT|nr:TonB-dependent receptor [Tunicatimonas sp. TK19036]